MKQEFSSDIRASKSTASQEEQVQALVVTGKRTIIKFPCLRKGSLGKKVQANTFRAVSFTPPRLDYIGRLNEPTF